MPRTFAREGALSIAASMVLSLAVLEERIQEEGRKVWGISSLEAYHSKEGMLLGASREGEAANRLEKESSVNFR